MLPVLIDIGSALLIVIISYIIYEIFNKNFKFRHIIEHMPAVYGLPISGILHKFMPIQSKF